MIELDPVELQLFRDLSGTKEIIVSWTYHLKVHCLADCISWTS